MRKIEKQMVHAVRCANNWKQDNTCVMSYEYGEHVLSTVLLHGNAIFTRYHREDGGETIEFSLCGWPSVTTRSRLNALFSEFYPDLGISQSDWEQFLSVNGGSLRTDESDIYQLSRKQGESKWTVRSRFLGVY